MRLLLAFLLPWLTFFAVGRPLAGIACLALQLTIVGWIPATIWAVHALGQHLTDVKIAALRRELTGKDASPAIGSGEPAASYTG